MNVVIVGAGQAGAWVAQRLRERDARCGIVLLGDEPWAPYERPPLSKGSIKADDPAPPFILTQERAEALGIRLITGARATGIDRNRKCVETAGHGAFHYDKLVLATGGRARRLQVPGHDLPAVRYLRTWEDALHVREALRVARSVLVIGGGWIGLEVAATARALGCAVTVVEAGPRLCARSVTLRVSEFLARKHAAQGVTVRLCCRLDRIEAGVNAGVIVHTSAGAEAADLVLVGVGLEPNTELAAACGLDIANGIVVDASGATSDPDIYATGDVANQPLDDTGARIRFESYANATHHALGVADRIAGQPGPDPDIPWFWSDQFDTQLQVLGLPSEDGEWVARGAEADGKFCLFQIRQGRLQAAVAANMGKEIKLAKRWMKAGRLPDPQLLGDLSVRLDKL